MRLVPDSYEILTPLDREATLRHLDALTMAQIEEYEPPPNPAKDTDSRYAAYQAQYGDESWELDALNPTTLADLIRRSVEEVRDDDLWEEAVAREDKDRESLRKVSEHWPNVEKYVAKLKGKG